MNSKTLALEEIYKNIVNDSGNAAFTSKGWIPLYTISPNSKIMIIGQAPGLKAQLSKMAWNDLSGNKLRDWLGVTKEQFYDTNNFALVPMDFYFPGSGKSGDLAPRKEFANKWHPQLTNNLDNLKLIILIGNYSQKHYLHTLSKANLTKNVKNYKEYLPMYFPLPHPSPRNIRWHIKNPWFELDVLPVLKSLVKNILKE